MVMCSLGNSKKAPSASWVVLLFFAMAFGVYICIICLKQLGTQIKMKHLLPIFPVTERQCSLHGITPEEVLYVHYPQPKTYSRGDCVCNPVRFFVILSMQRSGSGWFETLLNSHPNISSNGEVFLVKERRNNISTILKTLETVYNLEWFSSATKNECLAAVGLKWMLNQAIMEYPKEIVNYLNEKGVSVIILFRRNLLRRLISELANGYDKNAKQLNGKHRSHVHAKKEAEVLAQFRPTLNIAFLMANLSHVEQIMVESLQSFNSTHHMILYYEDVIKNHKALSDVQEFLRVPIRKLESQQVKIHTKHPSKQVTNWDDVYKALKGTMYEHFLEYGDYIT